jgi:D-alanyl-D-alanine dipeptidase
VTTARPASHRPAAPRPASHRPAAPRPAAARPAFLRSATFRSLVVVPASASVLIPAALLVLVLAPGGLGGAVPGSARTALPWSALIGEYAAGGDTLVVRERDGRLEALDRDTVYHLEADTPATYVLLGPGQLDGAEAIFEAGADGLADVVHIDERAYLRLRYGTEGGQAFRIRPVRPVEALRQAAMAATPPAEVGDFRAPDLVDLATLDRTIRLDIRYATRDNFMGAVFYRQPRAFLQRPAAEAVVRAHRRLRADGYGLIVFDAYRPWYVTWMFFHATPPAQRMFVANPAHGSRHNRGAAVDVTLYDLATGEPVPMPSGYDEFSPRAFPGYPGGTTEQRRNRDRLRRAMEAEGFRVYPTEWWHFDHREWRAYPILNLQFEQIER